MTKKRKPVPWTPRPVHYLFQTPLELAAIEHRIAQRTQDRTPCACGEAATVCDVGPPTVWRCQACADAELAALRASLAG